MQTLFDSYIAPIKAAAHHAKQDKAVGEYLLQYGYIDRQVAFNGGLPIGRIINLNQRIRELRLAGWNIETVQGGYRLISAPTKDTQ